MLLAAATAAATTTPSTTSVPTWLVVLVPILAALASGSAGVAGALLGGRAATRTAERNAALARQDEQRRWNRERRERAYIALLDARNDLVETRRAWDQSDPPSRGEFIAYARERAGQEVAAEQSLREALALVELVGSTAAVELSRRWVEALCPPRPRARREAKPAQDAQEEATTFRDPWVALIRKELGVDG